MKKTLYEVPSTKILEVRIQGTLLQNSANAVQRMTGYDGFWDDEE